MLQSQKWDMNYIYIPHSVVESPASQEGQHIHLPHGTRDVRAPPSPDVIHILVSQPRYNHFGIQF